MVESDFTIEISKHLPMKATYSRYTEHEYYTRLLSPTSDKDKKYSKQDKKYPRGKYSGIFL